VYGLVGRQVRQRLVRTVALPVAVIRPSKVSNGSGIRELKIVITVERSDSCLILGSVR